VVVAGIIDVGENVGTSAGGLGKEGKVVRATGVVTVAVGNDVKTGSSVGMGDVTAAVGNAVTGTCAVPVMEGMGVGRQSGGGSSDKSHIPFRIHCSYPEIRV
jgi:hypothetical protein